VAAAEGGGNGRQHGAHDERPSFATDLLGEAPLRERARA